ncbi:MAG TPA: hypothetical protein PLV42_05310 [bacterium]|nr:hypothetical protein [bacterium]
MTILDAELNLLAEIESPVFGSISFRQVIANFPPLLDRDFGTEA